MEIARPRNYLATAGSQNIVKKIIRSKQKSVCFPLNATMESKEGVNEKESSHALSKSEFASEKGTRTKTAVINANTRWNIMLQYLIQFKAKHGHCLVPNRYTENPQLGSWVSTQRRQYKLMKKQNLPPMTEERAKLLESIGFVWATRDPRHVPWEMRYEQLKEYKNKNGDCLVPIGHKSNPQLSNWVSTQRQELKLLLSGRSSRMTEEKIQKLNDIGFVWEAHRGGKGIKKRKKSTEKSPNADIHRISKTEPSDQHSRTNASFTGPQTAPSHLEIHPSGQNCVPKLKYTNSTNNIVQVDSHSHMMWKSNASTLGGYYHSTYDSMFREKSLKMFQENPNSLWSSEKLHISPFFANQRNTGHISHHGLSKPTAVNFYDQSPIPDKYNHACFHDIPMMNFNLPGRARTMEELWQENYIKLKQFQEANGHCNPDRNAVNSSLLDWIDNQRLEFCLWNEGKESSMNSSRYEALKGLGFQWKATPTQPITRSLPISTPKDKFLNSHEGRVHYAEVTPSPPLKQKDDEKEQFTSENRVNSENDIARSSMQAAIALFSLSNAIRKSHDNEEVTAVKVVKKPRYF